MVEVYRRLRLVGDCVCVRDCVDRSELLLNRQVAQPANDWTLVAMVDAVLWNLPV